MRRFVFGVGKILLVVGLIFIFFILDYVARERSLAALRQHETEAPKNVSATDSDLENREIVPPDVK